MMHINTQDIEDRDRKTDALLSLVGAGPGDPELITIKGIKEIQKADVILYDSLVNPQIFNLAFDNFDPYLKTKWLENIDIAPDDFDTSILNEWLDEDSSSNPRHKLQQLDRRRAIASKQQPELIFVGKRKGHKFISQDKINNLILEKLRQGKHVVRLKGGDPFVFARGVEELELAKNNGYDYRIIPGLTSGLASPVSKGISLTLRAKSDSISLVTGHEINNEKISTWSQILDNGSTLVVYMGLSNVVAIIDGLKKFHDSKLPAIAIHNGTLEDEKIVISDLDNLTQDMINHGIKSPAILVFGKYIKQDYQTKGIPVLDKLELVDTEARDRAWELN